MPFTDQEINQMTPEQREATAKQLEQFLAQQQPQIQPQKQGFNLRGAVLGGLQGGARYLSGMGEGVAQPSVTPSENINEWLLKEKIKSQMEAQDPYRKSQLKLNEQKIASLATPKISTTLEKYKQIKTENLINTVEQNENVRNAMVDAAESAQKIAGGFYGKLQKGFLKNLDPNHPLNKDIQTLLSVLTDEQLRYTMRTKGAISDKEMDTFKIAVANGDVSSAPRILEALRLSMNKINAEERGLVKSYRRVYQEDPGKWSEISSNIVSKQIPQQGQQSQYQIGQVIKKGNRNYTVVGFDTDGEPLVE